MFDIKSFDAKAEVLHFIGMGGIGMSSIAQLALEKGWKVTGSDLSQNKNILKLKDLGATVYFKHDENNIKGNEVIVYSSAIGQSNPEMRKALSLNLKIFKRAEILSGFMKEKRGIAIAGTHGKTTTTGLLTTLLEASGKDPSYSIGGIVKNLNGHAKISSGEDFIAEVDESDGSFLLFSPQLAAITNIDSDHLDFYKTEEAIFDSFLEFSKKIPKNGFLSVNIHDEKLCLISKQCHSNIITYGIENKNASYYAKNIEYKTGLTRFDLYYNEKNVCQIEVSLPGEHNVLNTLAAISIANKCGVSFSEISTSIKSFESVGRRVELLYNNNGMKIIDDYAHHPTEIKATLKAIRETYKESTIIGVFEPHRYSRTMECWSDYLTSFFEADKVFLTNIFAASENIIEGITSKNLVKDINKLNLKKNTFAASAGKVEDISLIFNKYKSKQISSDSPVIFVTMGAGLISNMVKEWISTQKNL